MVITAKGKYFTAGLDLSGPGGNRPGNPETEHLHPGWNFRRNYRSHHLLYDEFEAVEKPIVLAVNGICLGAGVEMGGRATSGSVCPKPSSACPRYGWVRSRAVGAPAGWPASSGPPGRSTWPWPGCGWSTERALAIGLVQDIFPAETFMDDVYAFCRSMMEITPEVLGLAKSAVDVYTDVQDRTVQRLSHVGTTIT